MKEAIILAGNSEEFERYLDDNGLTDSDVLYGYDESVMCGIRAKEVKIIGTFYNLPWAKQDRFKLRAESRLI